jgi:hypothetical protein
VTDPDLGDLPGLRQWGEELREATSRVEEERARPRERRRRRLPVRRLGVALAAMFLLVPGAVATRSIWDDPVERVPPAAPVPSTPAVRLAEGESAGVTWRLGGYDGDAGRRCLRFDGQRPGAADTRGGSCTRPQGAAALTVQTAGDDAAGFFFGTVASAAAEVEVTLPGGRRVRVPTTGVAADVLRRSRMRGGFRVFVLPVPGGYSASAQPPRVTAYDAAGGVVGSL